MFDSTINAAPILDPGVSILDLAGYLELAIIGFLLGCLIGIALDWLKKL